MNRDVDDLWTASVPRDGLKIHGFKIHDEDSLGDVPHERLLELDVARRLELRQQHRWRLHYFIAHSEPTRRVFENPALARWVKLIFDRPIGPTNSINFQFGSEQKLHQDMAVFSIDPIGWLLGIWIAAEDISPDSGPMVYYPGSHKDPMWDGLSNYPATFLKNCSKEQTAGYQSYLDRRAEDFPRHPFLGRKGDVLFWHGMLIHGGSPVLDPKSTRQSLVLHSIPPSCNKESQAKGPFNW
jgi:ectoine hydroxylase-related dioxygenase (phytanoyl-CoA dioxygenase family)